MKYSEVEYPKDEFGEKQYPQILCDYLIKRFHITGKILDVGCGRGFHKWAFQHRGLTCLGLDSEGSMDVFGCDFERDYFPFNSEFDWIFSKSTLEHVQNTEHILNEVRRVLNYGGRVIFMVPDWNSQWKIFYDDPTHVKPFSKKGLEKAFKLAGFEDVKCEYFFQLPFLWDRPYLKWIPYIVSLLPHTTRCKLIRFSKEKMLLLTAQK